MEYLLDLVDTEEEKAMLGSFPCTIDHEGFGAGTLLKCAVRLYLNEHNTKKKEKLKAQIVKFSYMINEDTSLETWGKLALLGALNDLKSNKMLDIILGSKLNAAADAGVQVEVIRASSPETLPVSDTDLCSLVMNILDNALSAARTSGVSKPVIRLDIHVKSGYFAFICENSADTAPLRANASGTNAPKHGFGMRIIRSIAERTGGLADTEYADGKCTVRVLIPLENSDAAQSAI